MKILFVHEVNYRTKVIFEMHEIPELLVEKGHEVYFIDFPEGKGIDSLNFRTEYEEIRGRVRHNTAIKLFSLPRFLPPPFDRLWTAAWGWISIRKILRAVRPEVVVLYAVPTNGWQTLLLSHKYQTPVIYRAIDMSHKIRKSLFSPLIKRAEVFVMNNCDLVLTHNEAMTEYVQKNIRSTKNTIVETMFAGVQEKNIELDNQAHQQISEIPNVVFMGTLFDFSGLEWFLIQMARKRTEGALFSLTLIGDGEARQKLEDLTIKLGLTDFVSFLGLIPFENLYEAMSRSSVAILPFDEIDMTHVALPAKVPQYLAAGIPTVSTRLKGLQSLLPEGQGVTYRAPGDDFMSGVIELLSDPYRCEAMVHDGKTRLMECANWKINIERLEMIFRFVTEKEVNS